MRERVVVCAILFVLIPGVARAADDGQPVTYELWFDASLHPHPENRKLDGLIAGDSVVVHVDPTRLFPDPSTSNAQLGFAKASAPPEVVGFYVVGPTAGFATPVSIQPGTCTVGSTVPAASPKPCVVAPDWHLESKAWVAYVCARQDTLASLVTASTDWSFVQQTPAGLTCLQHWTLASGKPITAVGSEIVNGGSAPAPVGFVSTKDGWSGTFQIRSNTRELRLTATSDAGSIPTTIPVSARARDDHSPVRVQTEVLATNRMRSVGFGLAVSPVRKAFFTSGPSLDCLALCAVTVTALLRLSDNDNKVLVRFGGGLAINFARPFQVNGGLLFGTQDDNTAWHSKPAWYVGIAVDPVLLAEAISGTSTKE